LGAKDWKRLPKTKVTVPDRYQERLPGVVLVFLEKILQFLDENTIYLIILCIPEKLLLFINQGPFLDKTEKFLDETEKLCDRFRKNLENFSARGIGRAGDIPFRFVVNGCVTAQPVWPSTA